MKSTSEFEQFYQSQLRPLLEEMEAFRKSTASKVTTAWAIAIGVAALLGVGAAMSGGNVILFILVVAALIGGGAVAGSIQSKYRSAFKTQLIGPLVSFYDSGLQYSPDGLINQGEFQSTGLFRHSIDRYRGEDLVSGTLGKTAVRFSEVHAEYKTVTRDSKGRRREQWHTIFKGLFFVGDFNKHFAGATYVLPDTAQKLFGSFGQTLQSWGSSHGELVKLEDPEFERAFAVYGADQVEARYILSPALMRRLLNFRNRTGRPLYVGFVSSCVCLALDTGKNMFEPRVFRTLLDPALFQDYWSDLNLAAGIVEELNLNTRIWTKE